MKILSFFYIFLLLILADRANNKNFTWQFYDKSLSIKAILMIFTYQKIRKRKQYKEKENSVEKPFYPFCSNKAILEYMV